MIVFFESGRRISKLNKDQLNSFHNASLIKISKGEILLPNESNGFIHGKIKIKNNQIKKIDHFAVIKDDLKSFHDFEKHLFLMPKTLNLNEYFSNLINNKKTSKTNFLDFNFEKKNYHLILSLNIYEQEDYQEGVYNISFTDDTFTRKTKNDLILIISIILIVIVLGTNIINILTTNILISRRLNFLSYDVNNISSSHYRNEIKIKGRDEIALLAKNIDNLRLQVLDKENYKKMILQNMSHDIKNPIGIIRSYAEAINDGISDIKDIKIIIEKSNELSERISSLINYVKEEYIEKENISEKIIVKDIIKSLVKEFQFSFKGNFILELDDSIYLGNNEKFKIAIQNIIENQIRFAKSKIIINLKKGVLKIANDGEKIPLDKIDKIFNLYEKSTKGQFGIGLAITKATINNMGYQIVALNEKPGVVFKIFKVN